MAGIVATRRTPSLSVVDSAVQATPSPLFEPILRVITSYGKEQDSAERVEVSGVRATSPLTLTSRCLYTSTPRPSAQVAEIPERNEAMARNPKALPDYFTAEEAQALVDADGHEDHAPDGTAGLPGPADHLPQAGGDGQQEQLGPGDPHPRRLGGKPGGPMDGKPPCGPRQTGQRDNRERVPGIPRPRRYFPLKDT